MAIFIFVQQTSNTLGLCFVCAFSAPHHCGQHCCILHRTKKVRSQYRFYCCAGGAHKFLVDHNIDGRILMPATSYVVTAWEALAVKEGKSISEVPVTFDDVCIHQAVPAEADQKVTLGVLLAPGNRFHVRIPSSNQHLFSRYTDPCAFSPCNWPPSSCSVHCQGGQHPRCTGLMVLHNATGWEDRAVWIINHTVPGTNRTICSNA
jgi:hypothetical protein